MLGIDIPLLAFSPCRDVVVEVTNAGGFGVLGGSSFTPENLEEELTWIDEHVGGIPYGIDIVVAEKLVGKGQHLTDDQLAALIPDGDRQFVSDLLNAHGIERDPDDIVRSAGGTAAWIGDI